MTDKEAIIQALIAEGLSRVAAVEAFHNMRISVLEGEDPEEILREIGLEPDFILALI